MYRHYQQRLAKERAKRFGSSSFSGYDLKHWFFYGPPRSRLSRRARDRCFWKQDCPDIGDQDEKEEREREKQKEEKRLKEEQLKKLKALTVENVDLHMRSNAFEHHTIQFHCTKGKDGQPVLRRGQEFNATVTFSRAYQKDVDDLVIILEADDDIPGKNLKERFRLDEEGTGTYRKDEDFGARIIESDSQKKTLKIAVYIPGDCVVGEWNLKLKTRFRDEVNNFVFVYPKDVIILFNPWSKADQVYFTNQKELDEYVLNEEGTRYYGNSYSIGSGPWTYGQFKEDVLDISLGILRKAFGFKMTPNMADPVTVSRALSRIINSCDDQGVLVGNWSGDYTGGKKPTKWKTSTAILRQYDKDKKPVRFGQCWVFAHLLTTVCRALGLPCRPVTNFDSAHDTDNTCTIDKYFKEDGDEDKSLGSDSIWNFHVWNEVWILRPDLSKDGTYCGWHVIDATPQELSYGMYQCGPCPVAAVKRGDIAIGFDTGFVFSEVNADLVHWVVGCDGEIEKFSDIKKKYVGNKMSTKQPDGKPHRQSLNYFVKDDPSLRLDLSGEYKYEEGTEGEREAVRRAVRRGRHGKKLFNKTAELEVSFDVETQTMIGSDVKVTTYVKNVTTEDKKVETLLSVRTCRYWNHSENNNHLAKEKFPVKTIKAGETESFTVTVPYEAYRDNCDESLSIFAYACAKDLGSNMPYSSQLPLRLRCPDLDFEGPSEAVCGETVTETLSFTNPLSTPLTGCMLQMEGDMCPAADDPNVFESLFWCHWAEFRDVAPNEKVVLPLRLTGEIEPDENGRTLTMNVSFQCKEIAADIEGCVNVVMHVQK